MTGPSFAGAMLAMPLSIVHSLASEQMLVPLSKFVVAVIALFYLLHLGSRVPLAVRKTDHEQCRLCNANPRDLSTSRNATLDSRTRHATTRVAYGGRAALLVPRVLSWGLWSVVAGDVKLSLLLWFVPY